MSCDVTKWRQSGERATKYMSREVRQRWGVFMLRILQAWYLWTETCCHLGTSLWIRFSVFSSTGKCLKRQHVKHEPCQNLKTSHSHKLACHKYNLQWSFTSLNCYLHFSVSHDKSWKNMKVIDPAVRPDLFVCLSGSLGANFFLVETFYSLLHFIAYDDKSWSTGISQVAHKRTLL